MLIWYIYMYAKFEFNRIHRLDSIVFTRTYTHAYITVKIAQMNSGDIKACKYVKISKSIFFMIAMLSLHNIYSESKKYTILYLFMHKPIQKNSNKMQSIDINCWNWIFSCIMNFLHFQRLNISLTLICLFVRQSICLNHIFFFFFFLICMPLVLKLIYVILDEYRTFSI